MITIFFKLPAVRGCFMRVVTHMLPFAGTELSRNLLLVFMDHWIEQSAAFTFTETKTIKEISSKNTF